MSLHSPSADDVVAVAVLSETKALWFWDAMIVRSAVALGCDTLWSKDLNAGEQIEGVTIRNPFA